MDQEEFPTGGVLCLMFRKKAGSLGAPHSQGNVCFALKKSLPAGKAVINGAHCATARSLTQSVDCCEREDNVIELI